MQDGSPRAGIWNRSLAGVPPVGCLGLRAAPWGSKPAYLLPWRGLSNRPRVTSCAEG